MFQEEPFRPRWCNDIYHYSFSTLFGQSNFDICCSDSLFLAVSRGKNTFFCRVAPIDTNCKRQKRFDYGGRSSSCFTAFMKDSAVQSSWLDYLLYAKKLITLIESLVVTATDIFTASSFFNPYSSSILDSHSSKLFASLVKELDWLEAPHFWIFQWFLFTLALYRLCRSIPDIDDQYPNFVFDKKHYLPRWNLKLST